MNVPDESVDVVFSNTVLEHVPVPEVDRLLTESLRILRPNGYMVHLIDPSDHFSHADPSVSAVNYLRFSEGDFAKFNSAFLYQNRLRASEWRDVIQRHRFEIVYWRSSIDARALRDLPSVPVSACFSHLSPEDLCTTAIWVVTRKLWSAAAPTAVGTPARASEDRIN
jgi:SAM-dependent methyltransferase